MSCGPQMPAMPLSMVKAGETVRVSRVKGNEDTNSDHRFLVLVNHLSGDFLASLLGEGRNGAS